MTNVEKVKSYIDDINKKFKNSKKSDLDFLACMIGAKDYETFRDLNVDNLQNIISAMYVGSKDLELIKWCTQYLECIKLSLLNGGLVSVSSMNERFELFISDLNRTSTGVDGSRIIKFSDIDSRNTHTPVLQNIRFQETESNVYGIDIKFNPLTKVVSFSNQVDVSGVIRLNSIADCYLTKSEYEDRLSSLKTDKSALYRTCKTVLEIVDKVLEGDVECGFSIITGAKVVEDDSKFNVVGRKYNDKFDKMVDSFVSDCGYKVVECTSSERKVMVVIGA